MKNDLLEGLADKSLTKEELKEEVKKDFTLLQTVIKGMTSEKAAIRYGCGSVLIDLSQEKPEKLYQNMDFFVKLLDSKHRIITWQTMEIIANLTSVDKNKKFDNIFDKYFSFINNDYMVTVANVVGHSGKIAKSKPYLIPKITEQLLKVENIKTTPHLTSECKRVITEKAIISFDMFFDQVKNKQEIFSFIKKHTNSSRKPLKEEANKFLNKWDK